jgi:hypothetical protein
MGGSFFVRLPWEPALLAMTSDHRQQGWLPQRLDAHHAHPNKFRKSKLKDNNYPDFKYHSRRHGTRPPRP